MFSKWKLQEISNNPDGYNWEVWKRRNLLKWDLIKRFRNFYDARIWIKNNSTQKLERFYYDSEGDIVL